MVKSPRTSLGLQVQDVIRRDRLAKLCVLVADRDFRTASLVQRILFSFGFRTLDITTNGESALALLRARPYDLIVTEWNMTPVDGVALIKAIRGAKNDKRIPRDIPILMLTARTDIDSVATARDAGVTEFVAKPFSAKTISNRIIQIIDNPRAFIESADYAGPDRRRRGTPPEGVEERRGVRKDKQGKVIPANTKLHQQLGNATEILNDATISEAQADLLKAESDFIVWAHADIMHLQQAYEKMQKRPDDAAALGALADAAYTIHSQAGIFGYQLGSEVAHLLIEYLRAHRHFTTDNLVVISKHIEAITTIFKQKIKDSGQDIARDTVQSLRQLTQKLG